MLNLPSLYDQNPQAWDALRNAGYRGSAEMAKHFAKCSVMDRALGYENSTARWHRGAGKPSGEAEARANQWLMKNAKPATDEGPISADANDGVLLLIACRSSVAVKARKVLSILGCEVTDI